MSLELKISGWNFCATIYGKLKWAQNFKFVAETLVQLSAATSGLSPHGNWGIQRCFVQLQLYHQCVRVSDRKSTLKCQLCEVLPQTWVPRKNESLGHIAQISPLITLFIYPASEKVKSGMSHDESSQLDTQVWILWSSQCATICAWVRHFDHAFQVEMGTECRRTQPATKCDFLWVNVVTRPQPCDDTAWGKPGRIFYGLRLLRINFQATSQQWFSQYY